MTQDEECKTSQDLVQECKRFLMYAKSGIEQAPLQVYVSAALFAPSKTVLREVGGYTAIISCVKRSPPTSEHWSALLLTLEGHSNGVSAVQFSPDGSKLASASRDDKVMVWDASTGAHLHTLEGHSDWVTAVQFSLDSSKLASASWDKKVMVWNPSTGACLRTLEGHSDRVNAVQFSPDGSKLASAAHDNKVMVWDLNMNLPDQTIDVGRSMSDLAFSPDGFYLKTNNGRFKLKSAVGVSQDENTCSVHLQVDEDWVLQHGHRTIWLPPELRPTACATSVFEILALGHSSGAISFWETNA
jgi:DNA-binding beta-propeller fold protein YncE